MTLRTVSKIELMRRRPGKGFRPDLGALDGRVLPSGGVSPVPGPVVAHLAAEVATARPRLIQVHTRHVVAHPPHARPVVAHPHRAAGSHRPQINGASASPPSSPPLPPSPPPTAPAVDPTTVSAPPAPIPPPANVPPVPGMELALEQQIVDLVNQQRAQNGLAPLQVDPRLVQAAQIQARAMAQLDDMDHDLPNAPLPTLTDRLAYVGYNYLSAGENIAVYYPDAATVMQGWMNSPGHRANILNPSFTQIGVGVAYDSAGTPYYSQEFGQPA